MIKIVCTALALSSVLIIGAVCAKAETGAKAESANTYRDAMRQCGAEWKASEARKSVQKGQGMAAWQAFRKECTARVGYAKKSRNSR